MSVVTVELESVAFARRITYTALVPDGGAPPFAVLYQLHGHSDDHRAWLQQSNLVRYAARWPLLIVLPSAENSWYVDLPDRPMERFLIDELPRHVAHTFAARCSPAAIGGLSMGGYGALRLALRHPERFVSAFAHSSRLPAREELPALAWARAAAVGIDELDVDALAARVDRARLPRLAFDCGTEDHLLGDSRRFHDVLTRLGIAHDYAEHPGGHTWDYWDAHVSDALAFHARALGLQPVG